MGKSIQKKILLVVFLMLLIGGGITAIILLTTKRDDKSCEPKCDGKECGSNGCNGNCGICVSGKACNSSGKCADKETCEPNCDGKDCGSDGCNGNCGNCVSGKTCSSGNCVSIKPNICNPKENCEKEGRVCGPDGCGGSCEPGCLEGVCKEGKCIKNNNFPDDEDLKYKIILKKESECDSVLKWLKNNFQVDDISGMQLYISSGDVQSNVNFWRPQLISNSNYTQQTTWYLDKNGRIYSFLKNKKYYITTKDKVIGVNKEITYPYANLDITQAKIFNREDIIEKGYDFTIKPYAPWLKSPNPDIVLSSTLTKGTTPPGVFDTPPCKGWSVYFKKIKENTLPPGAKL